MSSENVDVKPKRPMPLYRKILLAMLVVIAAFLGYVALQPSSFHVERSTTINASPEKVFAEVNDFHRWDGWSPWLKLDPQAKTTFEGPESGDGAYFTWSGNADVGEGSMKITESKPYERIGIQLDFIKPFPGKSDVEFLFKTEGDKTKVTWGMSGQNGFIGRCFCTFMSMDKMIGDKYDEGLAKLKAIAESK
ncbi:MAG: SRPBCC family protein [Pirellulaceae bacterium]|nr:SRPBCC family protein [Pirellulaceae bacterium]